MPIAGSYHSEEKQKIRELLWDEAFKDLVINQNKSQESLRYFGLPGAECIYIKQILKNFDIKKLLSIMLIELKLTEFYNVSSIKKHKINYSDMLMTFAM